MNDHAERSLSGRIDDICDAFEQVWKSNQRPSIVTYLKGFDGPQRLELLRELLLLDIDYRHRLGEDVNLADYETELPEVTKIFSEVIEEIVNRDTRLEDSKSDTRDSSATIIMSKDSKLERSAGRFEIIKHHAAGGLGDVFIARDGELNREVALKEIKEKFAHDEHSRSRFVVEAEITGRLEHPGIVPVYGMGKYDDGRPYYAMRFIKGESLKNAIQSYHKNKNTGEATLELRKLLNRFVDVCNAVEYAHSRGVIHRDLKPENVMLGKFGETLVVDWGLAKTVERKSPTEVNTEEAMIRVTKTDDSPEETQQGEVMGTAQFMSPEQAAGKIDELGPASDVYSLGAVLFCLLTGQPSFEEAKSEGLKGLLKAVSEGRFRKPREIDATAPKALEAICLKAMQTKTEDRYPSAKTLADDVERYLADEPVRAHREPIIALTSRWGRKHKTIVSSVVVLLITSVIALSTSTVLIAKANAVTKREKEKVQKQFERAEQNESRAMKAIKKYVETVQNSELLKEERFKSLIKDLLKDAHEYYLAYIEDFRDDETKLGGLAEAMSQIGLISYESGDKEKAIEAYLNAIDLRDRLVEENPTVTDYRSDLARSYNNIGALYSETGNPDKALVLYQKAVAIRERLTKENPTVTHYQSDFSISYMNIGNLYRTIDKPDEARESYQRALAIQEWLVEENPTMTEYQSDLAASHINIGSLDSDTGKPSEALKSYQKALAIQENLVEENPTVTEYQNYFAMSHHNIGVLYSNTNKPSEALKSYQKALAIREKLVKENPTVTEYQNNLAMSHNNIGVLYSDTGNPDAALKSYQKAFEIRQKLVEENPTVTDYRSDFAGNHINIGVLYKNTGKPEDALVSYRKANQILEKLVKENPTVTYYRNTLAGNYYNIGIFYRSEVKLDEALSSYQKSLAIREKLVKENPAFIEYRNNFADNHFSIGELYKMTGKPYEAIVSYQKALAIQEKLVEENPSAINYQKSLASTHNNIGSLYRMVSEPDKALVSYQKALAIRKKLTEENPSLIEMAIGLGGSYVNTAHLARSQKDYESAAKYFKLGVETLGKVVKKTPRHTRAKLYLRNAHWGRANLMQKLNRFDVAVADWEKAIKYESGSQKIQFQQSLAIALVKSKKHRSAYEEVKKLAQETKQQPTMQYNMACVISLASDVANDDKTLSASEKKEITSRYRNEAIDLLRHAQKLGFFKTPENLKLIRTDNDLDPLRKHEEFKKLLNEIETEFRAKQQKKSTKLPLIAPKPKLVTPKPKG